MAGFNSGTLTSKLFNYIDPLVLEPKKGELLGRQLFPIKNIPTLDNTYTYYWKERMGQASDTTNRATDGTVMDVNYHEEIGFIAEKTASVEYSQEEIDRAQSGKIDILGDKTQAAHDALNDWDDQMIFNGRDDSRKPIYGLTTDPAKAGYQVADDAPKTLDKITSPDNTNAFEDAWNIVNWFMDAAEKITLLPGYSNVKPLLLLPPKEYKLITRPLLNQYNVNQTIFKMLQDPNNANGATFSDIKPVEELNARYWNQAKGQAGKRNCGMIVLNDPNTVQIPVAMEAQRYGQTEYTHSKYSITYKERMGGLCVKFPAGFVRLNGLNDGSEKWAK